MRDEEVDGHWLWDGFWFTFLPILMLALTLEFAFLDGCLAR